MEGLWHLDCLERLDLSHNRIRRLPAELANLPRLSVLRLHGWVTE